jgi:hypothetical protein
MLAQYSSSDSGAGAVLFIYLLILLVLASIPAVIASNKGHSGVGFYFFGLFFFLPALIVALLMKPATSQPSPVAVPSPRSADLNPPKVMGSYTQPQPLAEEKRPRPISYPMGREVLTPGGSSVIVSELEDDAFWNTSDGGQAEPHADTRFVRVSIRFVSAEATMIGAAVYSVGVRLSSGDVIQPADEWHREEDLLRLEEELFVPADPLVGDVWFEVPVGAEIVSVLFESDGLDTSDEVATLIFAWRV